MSHFVSRCSAAAIAALIASSAAARQAPNCPGGQALYAVTPNTLYRIDNYATNPTPVAVGPLSSGFWDVASDPITGVMYGIFPFGSGDAVCTIDPNTGGVNLIATLPTLDYLNALDFSTSGTLYARGSRGNHGFWTIDIPTGSATLVGLTGSPSAGDLAVDAQGTVYSTNSLGSSSELQTIDVHTGVATTVAFVNAPGEMWGLEIDTDGKMYGTVGADFYRVDPTSEIPYGITFVCPCTNSAPVAYCTAGTTGSGCNASIAASGTASATAPNGFTVSVAGVEGQKFGIVFYGIHGRIATPWATGSSSVLCVKSPSQRMGTQNSGGTFGACDGALSVDWNAYRASHPNALGAPFAAGAIVNAQGWFRDPPSPKTTSLSNALEFVLQP
jgi:hypothetical protein